MVLAAGGPATVAQPAGITITVNTTADELNADGDCSLREAIEAANSDTAVDACTGGFGPDMISLPAGTYELSIAPDGTPDDNADGDLDITTDVRLAGAGADATVIDGGGIDRVFHLKFESVDISDLTVRGGETASFGGGVFVQTAALRLEDAVVSGNRADDGGGLALSAGSEATLTDVTMSGNESTGFTGGAIFNAETLTLSGVTLSGNTAATTGGALDTSGTASLTNVTVSGNSAGDGFPGAGIMNRDSLSLTNVTITNNVATTDGGGIYNEGGTVDMVNSIVLGNTASDCDGTAPLTSSGYNIDGDDTCDLTAVGDQPGLDPPLCCPLLGPLQDNGGPTETHALIAVSPAGSPPVDNADDAACPPVDQRGVPRPRDGDGDGVAACDVGAFELAGEPGDVDCSGTVNPIDAALVLQQDAGLLASPPCPENGDVNEDATVNSVDAALILQLVAGLVPSLPPP